MIDLDNVIKKVAERTNIDKEIVDIVCRHVFLYTIDIMKDTTDVRDILFNKLFKFKLKSRFKLDKTTKYH